MPLAGVESRPMNILTTTALFVLTAVTEIVGCYLPYLWLRQGRSPLAADTGRAQLGRLLLAADVAPGRCRSNLCGVWWHLRHHSIGMALGG